VKNISTGSYGLTLGRTDQMQYKW